MAVLTGALRTVKGNTIAQFYKDFTSYLTSSGAPPLANGCEVPQAPQSIRGHPEPLQTIYAIKQLVILLEVTQHLKTLELGEKPLPSTGAEPHPVRESTRAPRALPNNFYKTLRNRSGDTPSSLKQFTQ